MTDEERATEIAKKTGAKTVYKNTSGEFFTQENLAMLSVGNDAKKLTEYTPDIQVAKPEAGSDEKENEGGNQE